MSSQNVPDGRQFDPDTDPTAGTRATVFVNDKMQTGYQYALSAPVGARFDPSVPHLTDDSHLR